MSQFAFPTIDPAIHNGTQLAGWLNDLMPSLWSSHSGATRPAYALAGMLWADTSSDLAIKIFDGTNDLTLASVASGIASLTPGRVTIDPAASAGFAQLTGRAAAASPGAAEDGLQVLARAGGGGATVNLRGPSFTSPDANTVEILAGASPSQMTWRFNGNGTFAAPFGRLALTASAGTVPELSGRLAADAVAAGDDFLRLSARSAFGGGSVQLGGPSAASPNTVVIETGAVGARKGWIFDGNGNASFPGGGTFSVNGPISNIANLVGYSMYPSGTLRILQFAAGWFMAWNGTNGGLSWTGTSGLVWSMLGDGTMVLSGPAAKGWQPGGGLWSDTSDARVKTHIEPWAIDPEAMLRVRLRRWHMHPDTGRNPDLWNFGFIAQELEEDAPELGMVIQAPPVMGNFNIADMKGINATNAIYGLIATVQSLAARITALEAAA